MNFPFPFLALFLIFGFVLAYKRNQHTKKQAELNENFLERENRANETRRKDISNLPYILIPKALYTDVIPLAAADSEFSQCIDDLKKLSQEKILNLSSESNTDLKLKYGPQNLDTLSACDDNFATLESLIVTISKKYYEQQQFTEALAYLEFILAHHCDNSQIYLLAAQCYHSTGRSEKIHTLLDLLQNESFLLKNSVIESLNSYL